MSKRLDIDQLLIFFLLAVTIRQMGYYLASFALGWWGLFGYLQAAAVDLAIWRSSWWYRKYTGRKQRRWALLGVLAFSLVSAWYNFGYYTMRGPSLPWWHRALMAAVLPAGVALLSYLSAQKDESKYGTSKKQPEPSKPEPAPSLVQPFTCDVCGKVCKNQHALNAHQRAHSGKEQA